MGEATPGVLHDDPDALGIAIRRAEVAKLYTRQRLSVMEISRRMGVHHSTISRDIDDIEEAAVTEMEKDGRRMIRKLDREWNSVIAEAWSEYEKSKEPQTESTSQRAAGKETNGDKSLVKLVKKTRNGDPRFLALVIAAGEKLARLHRAGGFVNDPSIQVPIVPGAQITFYLPDNGRPVRTQPAPVLPTDAPKTLEAQVTPVATAQPTPHATQP